ncbi:hypothetical protein CRE_21818 [Caenorhabditis remanei]|uniref:Uncharacterized protein n=1 Tax=Caenorhabditis remanei TaxID=31234 RepID=E3MEM5_CAERE|nr:hypothetical protein CRE_21818 [Caenorhabditis remanei]
MEANYTGEIRANREDLARRSGMKSAKILKHSDDSKVPEPECGTDPPEVFDQSEIDEMDKILKEDVDKGLEMIEKKGEETYLSRLIPTRTEVNCKVKKCDSGKAVGHCICGPKKCEMDSEGLCKNNGSSNLYTFCIIISLFVCYSLVL